MKGYLREQVRLSSSPLSALGVTREYLQARLLESLQRAGAMVPLACHGGTALRFLFSLPRHSEDLDFALERPVAGYDFSSFLRQIRSDFEREGYDIHVRASTTRVVHSAFIGFPGLLHELGLPVQREQVIAVKLEVDTRPSAGAMLETSVVRRHVLLQLHHHDRTTLLAGKLNALLTREYTKGRDVFDLLWYLGEPSWPPPNLTLLNNALSQFGWAGGRITHANWRLAVRRHVAQLEWSRVVADVSPFLEHPADATLLTRENVLRTLDR